MPGAKVHKKLSLDYLGQYTPWLHQLIDSPSEGELKSEHRRFFHDWDFVEVLDRKFGRELTREALFHIILDIEGKRSAARKLIRWSDL